MCPSPEYYFAPFEGVYSPAESSAASFTGVPLEPPGPPEDGRATADIIAAQSQDYVDEKLAEYQATIYHLQGKWILSEIERSLKLGKTLWNCEITI